MNLLSKLPSGLERSIPVIVMGVLALISFSLLKSSPTSSSSISVPIKTQLDYYLKQFSIVQLADTGQLKSFIRGRYAEHSPKLETTSVQDFLFASTSKSNSYIGRSDVADFKDDANALVLKKNAAIQKSPIHDKSIQSKMFVKSDHLIYSQYPELVISEAPVTIEQHNRHIFAKSMRFNADEQQMRLSGSVKILAQPKN